MFWRKEKGSADLAVGICFGGRRRETVEEGERICILFDKGGDQGLGEPVWPLAMGLCFGGRRRGLRLCICFTNIKSDFVLGFTNIKLEFLLFYLKNVDV